jgi:D-amino-acid dehydrogenase
LAQVPWLWRAWRACHQPGHAERRAAAHRLALLSRERQHALTRSLGIDYERIEGLLVLLRQAADLKAAQRNLQLLQAWGVPHQLVDADGARQIEPGLNPHTALHGAIHLREQAGGNCRQFAHAMKAQAQRHGAQFHFETTVRQVHPGATPAVERVTGERIPHDAVVLCCGTEAHRLLQGLRLPMAAIHAHSVTAPLRLIDIDQASAPRAAVIDSRHRVVIARLGDRVRVAGGAALGDSPQARGLPALRALYRQLDDWFPAAALTREARHWHGARARMPDGLPVIGESGAAGVWLNLAHGTSGWTLACGAALALAMRMTGQEPPTDLSLFAAHRPR